MIFNIVLGIWIAAGILIGFSLPPVSYLVFPTIMYFHVPMAVAMATSFLIAAWYGGAWLRTRRVNHDILSYSFAEVGAICGLIATATGSIWARVNWGAYWNWDPQQVGIVATLLTYAALFSLRAATEDEDKQRNLWAVYAIFGAVAAIFWLFIYRHLPGISSLHPSGTLRSSEPAFRFALWFNITGYVLLLVRLAQLRARLERANQYLKDLSWT